MGKFFRSDSVTQNTSRGTIPRLAMINDISGFGRCSATVSLPVISVMGVQVCPVPTSVLSNHLGFPVCHFQDYTPHMREYLSAWSRLGLTFDGLYCGFLGNEEQIAIVNEFLEAFQPPFFLLDPVMGDHGKKYSTVTETHCRELRRLANYAHILTPNLTEACFLTDTPYKEKGWSDFELTALCQRLSELCPNRFVITGLQTDGCFFNICWEQGKKITCVTPSAGKARPGTGDLFASVLAADALQGREFLPSVKRAADFTALCIKGSEEAGTPVQEGVVFEKYLRELL